MKFCIIALPRSRSSILLEAIQLYFGIKILGEDIGALMQRYGDEYLKTVKELLEKNSAEESGVMRLHPLQMIHTRPFTVLDFDWFNFKQYDKIYFTYRESAIDNIASNFVATKLNKFTYQSESEVFKDVGPFLFSENDHYHVRDYIQSINIMNSLKQYLSKINIESQDLYYNNIPSYLKRYFPNTQVFHVETNYDYKKIVSNYDKIGEVYTERMMQAIK